MIWKLSETYICQKSPFCELFFFKFLFLLYFTLQYCIGFAIHWHESTTGVQAFLNMNPPPTSLPTTKSPLDCKETQPVNPKGDQSWVFIGKTDAEAETPILWPPDAKNWLIGKDPDAGKDWRQEKGTTEDEMVGWHHRLNEHEFE